VHWQEEWSNAHVNIVVVPVVPLFTQFLTIALQSAPSGTPVQVHFFVFGSHEKPAADPPTPIIAAKVVVEKTVAVVAITRAAITTRLLFPFCWKS
jgi:hypothetical protein